MMAIGAQADSVAVGPDQRATSRTTAAIKPLWPALARPAHFPATTLLHTLQGDKIVGIRSVRAQNEDHVTTR
jgi:hypothetical protein